MHAKNHAAIASIAAAIAVLSSPAVAVDISAKSFNPDLSVTLQGLYRKAKAESGEEITGFWPASSAHAADESEKNRGFLLGESELTLSANIDQYFKGLATLAHSDEHGTEVEEAWFQTLALGNGFTLRGGRFLSGIGYMNEQHPHAWDFSDPTLMQRALFGEHGYRQDGVQVKWLAPTDTFIQFGIEVGRGDRFPGTEINTSGRNSSAVFAHLGGDIGDSHAWRVGASHLASKAVDRDADITDISGAEVEAPFTGKSKTTIIDAVYKWSIEPGRSLKLQFEAFRRKETGRLACDDADPLAPSLCTGGLTDTYSSTQTGGYLQAVYQFAKAWRAGVRFDRLDSGTVTFGPALASALQAVDYTPKRSSVMMDWSPSEFSRLRLQLSRDQAQQGVTDNQLALQHIMTLGAHGAHKF